jgi:CDP-glucose 4,6-dehydratase
MEDVVNHAFGGTYAGKRVLLTGHTGFKGGWLALWLRELGATVSGYSLAPQGRLNLFQILSQDLFEQSREGDIRDRESFARAILESGPDIVFHLAAQPIVGASYREPLETFATNAMGTAHLLESLRELRIPAAVVVVTSDKCYRNDDSGRAFIESDPLGGNDVYSMSKAAAELITSSWHASFFAKDEMLGPLATGRAGNVIGGGDYAEDRIVPDAVRAHLSGESLLLRNPSATRPWQHVLESVSGYLALGARLLQFPDRSRLLSFNFGPNHEAVRSVRDLVERWLEEWPDSFGCEKTPVPPYGEAARLSLDPAKAREELGWIPVWNFARTVRETASWYRERHEAGRDDDAMAAFTRNQIAAYSRDAREAGASWIS